MVSKKIRKIRNKLKKRRVKKNSKKLQRKRDLKKKTKPYREEAQASKKELSALSDETGVTGAARAVKRGANRVSSGVSKGVQNAGTKLNEYEPPADHDLGTGGDPFGDEAIDPVGDPFGDPFSSGQDGRARSDAFLGLNDNDPFGESEQDGVDDFLGLNRSKSDKDPFSEEFWR